mgnify:CR=1 FL=1
MTQDLFRMPTMTDRKQRTPLQNKSLHLFCQQLADALNGAGYDMKKTLKPGVDIPWTKESIKEHIWRPVQEAMTGKRSTTEMNTVDPSEVYEVINRHMGEKFGVHVEWPHEGGE